jgi:DDE family transposase
MAQSSVETYPVMSIAEHFGRLTDPRMEERVEHRLSDIIVIAICGVICGADSWVEIEEFGKAKQEWLKGFLDLPNGIPPMTHSGVCLPVCPPSNFKLVL